MTNTLPNYINNTWVKSKATEYADVINPATAEVIAQVPLSPSDEVNQAVLTAEQAWIEWRQTPPSDRVQHLFTLKNLLEENLDDLDQTITFECGKTL